MDGGQISELRDSENWQHLYTLLHSLLTGWPPELWLQDSLANVSCAFTLVTWMHTHVTETSAALTPVNGWSTKLSMECAKSHRQAQERQRL